MCLNNLLYKNIIIYIRKQFVHILNFKFRQQNLPVNGSKEANRLNYICLLLVKVV